MILLIRVSYWRQTERKKNSYQVGGDDAKKTLGFILSNSGDLPRWIRGKNFMELYPDSFKENVYFTHDERKQEIVMGEETEEEGFEPSWRYLYATKFQFERGLGERSASQENFKYAIQCNPHGTCLIASVKVNILRDSRSRGTY